MRLGPIRLPDVGLPVAGLVDVAARAVRAPVQALRTINAANAQVRPVWTGGGRLHVGVHAVDPVDLEQYAADLADRVGRVVGVRWAGLDPGSGRMVVEFDPATAGEDGADLRRAVISAVEEAEVAAGASEPFRALIDEHPADRVGAARHTLEAAVDAASFVAASVSFAVQIPQRLIPIDLAPVVAFAQNQERVRGALERRFGAVPVDVGFNLVGAAANILNRHVLAPAVDLTHQIMLVRQEDSRADAFAALEPALYTAPPTGAAPAVSDRPRPVPVPGGPVERYDEQDLVATVAAVLATIPLMSRSGNATQVLSAGVPKAARLGREAYAVGVAEYLARHEVLVVRPDALRLCDRIDKVLVDPDVLADTTPAETASSGLSVAGGTDVEVLLTHPRAGIDLPVVEGGRTAAELVAWLQDEGHTVALIARGGEPALAAADCGVAIVSAVEPGPVPWHAHLIGADGPAAVAALMGICPRARSVSRRSVTLALAGSVASAATALVPLSGGPIHRILPVSLGVDFAALVAMGYGRRAAQHLPSPDPVTEPARPPWHRLTNREVLERLGSTERGLTPAEAELRSARPATAPGLPQRMLGYVVDELRNPLTPMLALGAGLSLTVGSVVDAALVTAVLVANAGLGAAQRWRAERTIAELGRTAAQQVRVRRGGTESTIVAADLVVGDVVLFSAGEDVPADCRLLHANGLEVDESAMTGESLPVSKSAAPTDAPALADQRSMVFDGTAIAAGRALAVVVAVGADTEAARASAGLSAPRTGVEARLESIAARTTPVALASGALTAAAGLLRGRPLTETLGTGVSLAVAAVPEGLPILATAAQLAAGKRLARQGVLVRNARAVEALGRADVLCVDKTGTLTEGMLQVASLHDGVTATPVGPSDAVAPGALPAAARRLLAAAYTVSAATPAPRRRPGSTDAAIVAAARSLPRPPRPIAELPYESGRGYHAVRYVDDGTSSVAVVGAPETVLARCAAHRHPEHGRTRLDLHRRRDLDATVARLAGDGGRVLAVAAKSAREETVAAKSAREETVAAKSAPRDTVAAKSAPRDTVAAKSAPRDTVAAKSAPRDTVAAKSAPRDTVAAKSAPRDTVAPGDAVAAGTAGSDIAASQLGDEDIGDLELLGFLVLADPPRPQAKDALDRISRAGVRPVIVTGDHPATARSLAVAVGLLDHEASVLTGPELDGLGDDELDAVLETLTVCARVTPAHKARLVAAYRRRGHAVAMTGDGVNDAAAIRLADVGIAIGMGSTSAARSAADVVLVRSDIGLIVDAIIQGRALWVAVRDAVANLLGHNYGEIGVITGISLLTGTTPLTARQLLLVNLFTDSVPSMSIAMRPPPDLDPERLLTEGPDRSFGAALTDAMVVRGIATGLAGVGGYAAARLTGTLARARTVTMLSIVGAQLGQTALTRPNDPVVVGAAVVSGAALLGIAETPFVSGLFGCRPVGPIGLGIAGTAAAAGALGTLALPPVVSGIRGLLQRSEPASQPVDVADAAAPRPDAGPGGHATGTGESLASVTPLPWLNGGRSARAARSSG